MKKKVYKVSSKLELLNATHEAFKNRVGETKELSPKYKWAESEEDAVGQCIADLLSRQINAEIISVSEKYLNFSADFFVNWGDKKEASRNTIEVEYSVSC